MNYKKKLKGGSIVLQSPSDRFRDNQIYFSPRRSFDMDTNIIINGNINTDDIINYQKYFNDNIVGNKIKYYRDSSIINPNIRSGRNLLFDLPYYNLKQSLIYDVLSYKSNDKNINNIRFILSLLNFNENLDELDNLDDIKNSYKVLQSIGFKRKKRSLKTSSSMKSSSSISSRKKKIKGGNTLNDLAKGYIYNHFIFDNKHDFKNKNYCKKNTLCNKFIYTCDDLVDTGMSSNSFNLIKSECGKEFNENNLFLNYIKYFTNNNLNNFIYLSYLDVKNVDITHINLFDNMLKPTSRDYDTNIDMFMKQFTNTDFPAFFTDGKLSRNSSNNLPIFLKSIEDNYSSLLTPSDKNIIKEIVKNTGKIYESDFLKLHNNLNDYIMKRRIISIEDVNDPMSVELPIITKFFNDNQTVSSLYNDDIKEVLGFITSNMINTTNKFANIFTHKFNLENIEYVYYNTPPDLTTKFAIKFKNKNFTNLVLTNQSTLFKDFDFIYLINKDNSFIYSSIPIPTQSQLKTNNIYIGLDIYKYTHYNSNRNISESINNILAKINNNGDFKINIFPDKIQKKNKQKDDYKIAAISFIIFYYFYVNNFLSSNFDKIDLNPIERNNKIKELSRILYDLKKAGDLSKVLFVYYYSELENSYPNNPNDPISRGLLKLKNSTNGLIKDQLILSTNDTLASLSSILRNRNDVFFNMQYNYSYCAYRTSDYLKVTIADVLKQIDLSFGTLFINNQFDIKESIKNVVNTHTTTINQKNISKYVNLLKFINTKFQNDAKNIILRNKDPLINYRIYIISEISKIHDQIDRNYYITNYYSATLLYLNYYIFLYIKEFKNYINSFIIPTNQEYIDKFIKLLFNSLDFDVINKTSKPIFVKITKIYIAKFNFIINKIIEKIKTRLELEYANNVSNNNLFEYYENVILKYTKFISNLVLILENFLYMDNKNSNIFDNINDLNNYLKNIIIICSAASDDTNLTITYKDDIKKYNQINMYTILLSDINFSNILSKIKNISDIKTDILYNNLFDANFINNLKNFKNFYNILNEIDTSLINDPELKIYMDNLIHHIVKLMYYIFIQYIIPYYFNNSDDSNNFRPSTSSEIVETFMNQIKKNIEKSFDNAKQEKLKPINKILDNYASSKRIIRQQLIDVEKEKIQQIEQIFDNKKNEIIKKINSETIPELFNFYQQIAIKNLPIDIYDPIFFVQEIEIIQTNDNKYGIKLSEPLNKKIYNDNIPIADSTLSEESIIPIIIDERSDIIYQQLFNIYNFIIHDTPEYKSNLEFRTGGNKKFKYH